MVYLGTSGFKFADWKGTFYPLGLKEKDQLAYYAGRFNALEINSTYYRLLHPATFARLAEKVPEGFEFTVKLHRSLTHQVTESWASDLRAFLDSVSPLRQVGKLGCLVAQFPTSFRRTPENLDYLAALAGGCGEVPLAVEFRHRSWAEEETFDFLRAHGIAYVCVDEPQFSSLMPPVAEATAGFGYVRFHGRNYQTWWKVDARLPSPCASISDRGRGPGPELRSGRRDVALPRQYGPRSARGSARLGSPPAGSGEEKLRYDYLYSRQELEEWLPRIKQLHGQTGRVYVFMNNCFQGKAAVNALELGEMLEEHLGPVLPRASAGSPAQPALPMEQPPLAPPDG